MATPASVADMIEEQMPGMGDVIENALEAVQEAVGVDDVLGKRKLDDDEAEDTLAKRPALGDVSINGLAEDGDTIQVTVETTTVTSTDGSGDVDPALAALAEANTAAVASDVLQAVLGGSPKRRPGSPTRPASPLPLGASSTVRPVSPARTGSPAPAKSPLKSPAKSPKAAAVAAGGEMAGMSLEDGAPPGADEPGPGAAAANGHGVDATPIGVQGPPEGAGGMQPYGVLSMGAAAAAAAPAADSIVIEMECPQHLVGRIIGKGGDTIMDLQGRTKCSIQVDQKFPEGQPRKISITGKPEGAAQAKELIEQVMAGGPMTLAGGPLGSRPPMGMGMGFGGPAGVAEDSLDCPHQLVGRIIGRNGETIKDLQNRSGARIQIDQNFPDGEPRKITVSGAAGAVAYAVDLIKQVMNSGPGGPPGGVGGGSITQTIDCPKHLVGRVIGRGGETIRHIQNKTRSRVQIEQNVPDNQPCRLTISGDHAAVAAGVHMVHEVMQHGPVQLQQLQQERRDGGDRADVPPASAPAAAGYYGAGYPSYPAQQPYPQYPPPVYGYPPPMYPGYPPAAGYDYAAYYGQQGAQPYMAPPAAAAYPPAPAPAAYPAPAAPAPAPKPAGGWTEYKTAEGLKYWHNAESGQSVWEKPAGMP